MAKVNLLAKEDAKKIAEDLNKNYAGRRIHKSSIRRAFDIPINRSIYVWSWLQAEYGYEIYPHTIGVPAIPKPKETKEETEIKELDEILNG